MLLCGLLCLCWGSAHKLIGKVLHIRKHTFYAFSWKQHGKWKWLWSSCQMVTLPKWMLNTNIIRWWHIESARQILINIRWIFIQIIEVKSNNYNLYLQILQGLAWSSWNYNSSSEIILFWETMVENSMLIVLFTCF